MKTKLFLWLCFAFCFFSCTSDTTIQDNPDTTETIYFPPANTEVWETKTAESLGWNLSQLTSLLDFVEENNSKSFIILYNGKIVVETYMNGHDASKPWYWASAGKTLTTAISGIAQDEGIININNKVSDYLGEGWTSAPIEKENLITCKNLLSMNSGLDDGLGDNVSKENLQYKADAGTRWAYHNVYKKMQDVVAAASNTSWNTYFNTKLKTRIGMTGAWINSNDFNVYWSNSRSMARFGLLMYAKGKWNTTQVLPESFLNEAVNTSQNINQSYGYLWWLNGKENFHLPASQLKFDGKLIPNAPDDTFAALGKNDQKIYIVPSKKLVIIRMGDAASGINFARSDFDNALWDKISAVIN